MQTSQESLFHFMPTNLFVKLLRLFALYAADPLAGVTVTEKATFYLPLDLSEPSRCLSLVE